MKMKIREVIVGERIREELGDLRVLERSISRIGLLNPIIINQKKKLLAGERRLRACQNLGWEEIEVHIVNTTDDLSLLEIEAEENFIRKDFTNRELEKVIRKKESFFKKGLWFKIQRLMLKLVNWVKESLSKWKSKKQSKNQ